MASAGREVFFDKDELIVSKTNLKGHLTYMNHTFLDIAGYTEAEVIGKPHNVIRHPDMPRCVFKLLWDKLQSGSEIFAYVVNVTKNGDYYWVIAHVTPSYGSNGEVVGYHSTRRVPNPQTIQQVIIPLYKDLKTIEDSFGNRKDGLAASFQKLLDVLSEKELEYDEFIAQLEKAA
ncbi:MAG: chemotaxis protein [Rhodobiaceae bacterium]|nr:MAG: chemotaxis protein [Rhodobiaceae bacterium]